MSDLPEDTFCGRNSDSELNRSAKSSLHRLRLAAILRVIFPAQNANVLLWTSLLMMRKRRGMRSASSLICRVRRRGTGGEHCMSGIRSGNRSGSEGADWRSCESVYTCCMFCYTITVWNARAFAAGANYHCPKKDLTPIDLGLLLEDRSHSIT